MSAPERPLSVASPRLGLIVFGAFLVIDTLAQLAFKWAGESIGTGGSAVEWLQAATAAPQVWVAAILYFGLFVIWMLVLRTLDLSHAFPLSAAAYVTVPLSAWALFGEEIGLVRAVGIGLIVIGMVVIGGRE